MIIRDITKTGSPEGPQQLSATVSWETPSPRSFEVFFEFKSAPGELAFSADPFVAGFLIAAMVLGEDLEIQGPADPEFLERIEQDIIPLLRRWFPSLKPIELKCPETQAPPPATADPGGIAAFSGGLDALYTAVRHRGRLNWLLTAQGFDVRTFQHLEWSKVMRETRIAAEPVGLPLFEVRTNLREIAHYQVLRPFKGEVHPNVFRIGPNGPIGPFFVALGRCLLPACSRFLLSSTEPYEHLYPYGSHPLLDPMWSTSRQEMLHIGCEFNRSEKLEWLMRASPESLRSMRVCWWGSPRKANCGRCEKCQRTLAEARLAGATGLMESFDEPFNPESIKFLDPGPVQLPFWKSIAERAASQDDHELARAAEIVLGRRVYLPKLWKRVKEGRLRQKPRNEWRRLRRLMDSSRASSAPTAAGSAELPAGGDPASAPRRDVSVPRIQG